MIDGRRGKKTNEVTSGPAPRPRRSLGRRLAAIGVGADAITTVGVLLAAVTAVFVAYHWFIAGVALDHRRRADGHPRRARRQGGRDRLGRGAFFDSVADRVADSLIFGGLAWYFIRAHDAQRRPRADRDPRGEQPRLLPARQGRIARVLRPRRDHGAGRTAHLPRRHAVHRLLRARRPRPAAPHLARADRRDLRRALRPCLGRGHGYDERRATAGSPPPGRRRAWRAGQLGDPSRRGRRDLVPLSTRLRVVFGANRGTRRTSARAHRPTPQCARLRPPVRQRPLTALRGTTRQRRWVARGPASSTSPTGVAPRSCGHCRVPSPASSLAAWRTSPGPPDAPDGPSSRRISAGCSVRRRRPRSCAGPCDGPTPATPRYWSEAARLDASDPTVLGRRLVVRHPERFREAAGGAGG